MAKFKYTETIRNSVRYGHAFFHQADFEFSQKTLGSSFENLTHDRCSRFVCANSHIQMKSWRLENDLASGRFTPNSHHGRLPPAVKKDGSNKSLVIGYIFDNLKLEEFGV